MIPLIRSYWEQMISCYANRASPWSSCRLIAMQKHSYLQSPLLPEARICGTKRMCSGYQHFIDRWREQHTASAFEAATFTESKLALRLQRPHAISLSFPLALIIFHFLIISSEEHPLLVINAHVFRVRTIQPFRSH